MKSLVELIQEAKINNDFVDAINGFAELIKNNKNIKPGEFDEHYTELMHSLSNFKIEWKSRLNKSNKPFIMSKVNYDGEVNELIFVLLNDNDTYSYVALRLGQSHGWHVEKNNVYRIIPKNYKYFVLPDNYKEVFNNLLS